MLMPILKCSSQLLSDMFCHAENTLLFSSQPSHSCICTLNSKVQPKLSCMFQNWIIHKILHIAEWRYSFSAKAKAVVVCTFFSYTSLPFPTPPRVEESKLCPVQCSAGSTGLSVVFPHLTCPFAHWGVATPYLIRLSWQTTLLFIN